MSRTSVFRRQHEAAIALVEEIGAATASCASEAEAYRIGLLLAKLNGLLRLHFLQEDHTLYPAMIGSSSAEAATVAKRFHGEIGGLGEAYRAFAERWPSAARIWAGRELFAAESRAIFAALADRIRREDEILYPLADALAGEELARIG
jgi:hypothetical protein